MPPPSTPKRSPENDPHLRRNFTALLIHGLLGQTGFRLLQAPTFLPAYLSLLAGNNSAIGIARALQSLGMSLSPYLAAWMVERRTYVKRLAVSFGALMRSQILLLSLTAFFVPRRHALVAVWIVIGMWGLASGLQNVSFNFIISKVIPPMKRGRLLGLRNATSGITLLFVSVLGGWIVDRSPFPAGYAWTFLLAFVLTSLGLVAFATIHETPTLNPQPATPFVARLKSIPALLAGEPGFKRFFAARLLGTAGRSSIPFYILYVGQRYELSGSRLATFTIVFTLANAAGAMIWGLLADHRGFRIVFLAGLCVWMAGNALVLTTGVLWTAYVVFFLVSFGASGFMLAGQNLVLEFGDEQNRAMRIGATNASSELVGALGYLGAGLLADLAPLRWVFWLSLAFQLAALLQIRKVREPRG